MGAKFEWECARCGRTATARALTTRRNLCRDCARDAAMTEFGIRIALIVVGVPLYFIVRAVGVSASWAWLPVIAALAPLAVLAETRRRRTWGSDGR